MKMSHLDDVSRRQETRLAQNDTLLIEVFSANQHSQKSRFVICSSVDVSANGIRAHVDDALPLKAIYQMRVESQQQSLTMHLAVQVKWLSPDDTDGYFVGLEVLESDDTDIDQWKLYIANLLLA